MHINLTEINNLEERWNDLVNLSLGQSPISGQVFQSIIRDTFRVLNFYDTAETISKTLAQILILMSEFAAYLLMSDDDQGFNPVIMSEITGRLLWGFARGFQSSGLSYPILQISDEYYFNMSHINVETNDLLTLQFNDEYPLPF